MTLEVPESRVLHLMYEVDPDCPWRGVGPLQDCLESHNLSQALETRLRQEVGGPVGTFLPMPDLAGDVTGLEADVNTLRGEAKLTPSTSNNWQTGGVNGAPRTDWKSLRIGAEPPDVLRDLRTDVERSILAACGVPATLVTPSDGSASREGLRQFLHLGIQPIANGLSETIRDKFDLDDFAFDFAPLMASDLAGRARAFGQLVKEGMAIPEAARLTNLLSADDGD